MKKDNLEKLGQLIDKLDNIIQMSSNSLLAHIHWEGVKSALPEIRENVLEVYIDEGGSPYTT